VPSGCDPVSTSCWFGALHVLALLVEHRGAAQVVAEPRLVERIAVQVGDVVGDLGTLGVVPRAGADAVAGVDGLFATHGLLAQIGAPGLRAAGRRGQRLAMLVGTLEAAEFGAVPWAGARQEEAHRLRGILGKRRGGRCRQQHGREYRVHSHGACSPWSR
jgi:hypothetical protein